MSPLIELASALMAIPSITPHDKGCQDIIRQRLEKLHFHSEVMPFGEVSNLWCRLGQTPPLLVFAGHTDVVPAGPEASWTSPPFSPSIRQGYLYGRGASDMKAAIAAMIIAVEQYLQNEPAFSGSLGFLITSDEEGKGEDGTKKVLEVLKKRGEAMDFCIVGEPSSEKQVGDQIRIGRRGSLHGKLTVYGKQGHVAYPDRIDNPIHKSLSALLTLAKTTWDQGNGDFPPTSFQMTHIEGGTGAMNVVPGILDIAFNFRFSPELTPQELKKRTERILAQQGLNYAIEWQEGARPFLSKKETLISVAREAIHKVTGLTAQSSTAGGTSDARFFAERTDAEIIELGLLNATAHEIDESVAVSDVEKLAMIYQAILGTIFSATRTPQ